MAGNITKESRAGTKSVDSLISEAVVKRLGDIRKLPESAQKRILRVYKSFFNAYLDICSLKGRSPVPGQWDPTRLDPEILEYMRHFFSDYQHILREWYTLERHADALMQIDPETSPAAFDNRLAFLVSDDQDNGESLILDKILEHRANNA
jgi:hypothetical protein